MPDRVYNSHAGGNRIEPGDKSTWQDAEQDKVNPGATPGQSGQAQVAASHGFHGDDGPLDW
jgi:hypothetical protein